MILVGLIPSKCEDDHLPVKIPNNSAKFMAYNYRRPIPPPKPPAKKDLWDVFGWDYAVARCFIEEDVPQQISEFMTRSYLFDEEWVELEKLVILDSCKKLAFQLFYFLNKSPAISKNLAEVMEIAYNQGNGCCHYWNPRISCLTN